MERTFRFELDRDIEDLCLVMDQDPAPTWLSVERPTTTVWVDGWLTASSGSERIQRLVRLGPKAGDDSHQLLIPDYQDWTSQVEVDDVGSESLIAELEPRRGCLIDPELTGGYVVQYREHGAAEPWQTMFDRSVKQTTTGSLDEPLSSWLAPGVYDIRIETSQYADEILEEVRVSATSAPLRLESKKLVGLKISGTMESNVALGHGYVLYLWRRSSGVWRLQRTKLSGIHHDDERDRHDFAFQGLIPGEYRATLDESGDSPVAHWTLLDEDLADVHIAYQF